MSKKGIVAALICMLAFSLALVGCGGDDPAKKKESFAGTWNLEEYVVDGQPASKDELEALKAIGLEIFVNLNEDGTASLVLFGEVIDGTWEAKSATEGTIVFSGKTDDMKIDNSKLKFEKDGASMVFSKGAAKEVPTRSSSASSASEGAASDDSASEGAASNDSASEGSASASSAS